MVQGEGVVVVVSAGLFVNFRVVGNLKFSIIEGHWSVCEALVEGNALCHVTHEGCKLDE